MEPLAPVSPRLHGAVASYLAGGYARVRGMSSHFSAGVVAELMAAQTAAGIAGGAVEIGTFEGRFFIAMALCLETGEKIFGIDTFDWPDDHVEARLRANIAAEGAADGAHEIWRGQSSTVGHERILASLGGPARIIHVDGDHDAASLADDLELAMACIRPDGLIVLDDMLSPIYPTLVMTVQGFLNAHSDWQVSCIIDRQTLSGAAKYVLARRDMAANVADWLHARMPDNVVVMGARFAGYEAPIVSATPELPRF